MRTDSYSVLPMVLVKFLAQLVLIASSERLHDAKEWFSPPHPVMAWASPLLCGLWREGWKMPRPTLFSLPRMENKWNGHHFLSEIALRGDKMHPAVDEELAPSPWVENKVTVVLLQVSPPHLKRSLLNKQTPVTSLTGFGFTFGVETSFNVASIEFLSDFYSVSLSLLGLFFSFVPSLSSLPHASALNPIMHSLKFAFRFAQLPLYTLAPVGGLRMRSYTERPHQTQTVWSWDWPQAALWPRL